MTPGVPTLVAEILLKLIVGLNYVFIAPIVAIASAAIFTPIFMYLFFRNNSSEEIFAFLFATLTILIWASSAISFHYLIYDPYFAHLSLSTLSEICYLAVPTAVGALGIVCTTIAYGIDKAISFFCRQQNNNALSHAAVHDQNDQQPSKSSNARMIQIASIQGQQPNFNARAADGKAAPQAGEGYAKERKNRSAAPPQAQQQASNLSTQPERQNGIALN